MKQVKIDLIYNSTLKHASRTGVANIVVSLLAKEAGIAEGTIFYYFKDMRELIDYCALRYERELLAYCMELIEQNMDFSTIWDVLFDYVISEPEGGVYYFDYVNYYGFDPTETNTRASIYLKISRSLFKDKEALSDHKLLILWDYITTQLFYYTTKIYKHDLENTKENLDFIKHIVFITYNNI